ncbi:hypothetical protein EsH8_I_001341 [Colletotrichum jinshuiense]
MNLSRRHPTLNTSTGTSTSTSTSTSTMPSYRLRRPIPPHPLRTRQRSLRAASNDLKLAQAAKARAIAEGVDPESRLAHGIDNTINLCRLAHALAALRERQARQALDLPPVSDVQ